AFLNSAPAMKVVLASPAEEKFSLPGFSFASASRSFTFFAGRFGGVISISGDEQTRVIPEKSLIGSNGRLLFTSAATVWPLEVNIGVWPWGGAFAAAAVPASPGRFSTITFWFQRLARSSATIRAIMSVTLPAPNGTMMVTRWFG